MNPYAEMVKGYREETKTLMMAQLELKQDFSRLVKGLSVRVLFNTLPNSFFDLSRSYNPFYYQVQRYDRLTDEFFLTELKPKSGKDILGRKSIVKGKRG